MLSFTASTVAGSLEKAFMVLACGQGCPLGLFLECPEGLGQPGIFFFDNQVLRPPFFFHEGAPVRFDILPTGILGPLDVHGRLLFDLQNPSNHVRHTACPS